MTTLLLVTLALFLIVFFSGFLGRRIRQEDLQEEKEKLEKQARDLALAHNRLREFSYNLEEKIRDRTFELSVLYDVSNAISYTLDYQQLLKLIMESLFKIVNYDICASLLFDADTASITLKPAYPQVSGFVNEVKNSLIDYTSMLTGENIRKKRMNAFSIPASSDIEPGEERQFTGLRSSFDAPFVVGGKTIGMINVSSCKDNAFDEEDAKLIYTIANQASNAIERLQAVITAEKSKMESMVEGMAEGVIMIDERGEIAVLNPQARRMLDFELDEEVTSRTLDKKMKELNLDKTLQESQSKRRLITKEITIPQGEGSMVLHSDIAPVKDTEGDIIGIVTILRDITKEKEIDRMKTDFISTVSHELRTPLTTMREFASIISDEIPGKLTKDQREYIDIIKGNIDRLARLINDLLDISKIEARKIELNRTFVDIANLVKGIVSTLKPEAENKHIEFKTLFSTPLSDIYIDPDRITQVFINLVGNAIKFTPQNRQITVEIVEKTEVIECSVADTGIGIAPENMDRLFSRFQQFGRMPGPGAKGTGLGLAITKELVQMHNGKIWAESELEKGTKFIFTLPKYSREKILYENIEKKITEAKQEHKSLSVFIAKLDNYSEIKKEFGEKEVKKVCLKIMQGLENILRSEDVVIRYGENEIITLVQVNQQELHHMNARLTRIVKESIFEFSEEPKINFSYGFSIYPDNAGNVGDLLEQARESIISETQQRLKKNIMIVDDEPDFIELLKNILKGFKYTNITEAYDGDEALKKVKAQIPELIILDMNMPVMSGYEVIGRLKGDAETKEIPILIMSAYQVEKQKLREHVKKKAIPIVNKSSNAEQLKRFVDYLL